MIEADICDGKVTRGDLSAEEITTFLGGGKTRRQVLWLDVANPDETDWGFLREQFAFHPLSIEDAQGRTERAKMDVYPETEAERGYLFLSIRAWRGSDDPTADLNDVTQEIDIFLGPNYIVTIHPEGCGTVGMVRSRWEKHPERLPDARHSPAYLLYLILDAAVDECFPAMDAIDQEIDTVETAIYDEDGSSGPTSVRPALHLRKKLLLLRQTVTPLRDLVNQILRTDDPDLLPPSLRVYYQDVFDHALRLVEQVDLHRDILSGALEASMAQTSHRLNVVMKKMTGISTILMSCALIAGIYGMNFSNMPELKTANGYYWALAGMAALSLAVWAVFKRIGWF